MAKVAVSLKIDVSKIDKTRLFKGQKGTYLDAQVFIDIDELDQYGNSGMITQAVTKEEKAQGVKGNILGNCKVFWKDGQQAQQPQQQGSWGKPQQPQQQQTSNIHNQSQQVPDYDDDIPFATIGLMHSNNLMHCI